MLLHPLVEIIRRRHVGARVGVLTLSLVAHFPAAAWSQRIWTLEEQPYYTPFRSEPRAAHISITALASSSEFPFVRKPGRRRIWDISLGTEVPIFGRYSDAGASAPNPEDFAGPTLRAGESWWGVFAPIGFHMVEDFKDDSAPIINTDYRFGASVKYLRGLKNDWSMGFKVEPIGHESTHLGDEFTLSASQNDPDFFRINVSYEFWDVAAYLNKDLAPARWRFQGGVVGLWGDNGFYTFDPSETGGREVTPSRRSLEPYFSIERLPKRGWLGRWNLFLSMDLRSRIVFDYFRTDSTSKEDRQLTTNFMLGLLRVGTERGVTDFFVRFYYGVNRNGQFRSESDYFLVGFGLHVGI